MASTPSVATCKWMDWLVAERFLRQPDITGTVFDQENLHDIGFLFMRVHDDGLLLENNSSSACDVFEVTFDREKCLDMRISFWPAAAA